MNWLVNSIPDIRSKRYLELGIFDGSNFNLVCAGTKHSVDIKDWGMPPTFNVPTDDFFAQKLGEPLYDVIYIDACHDYRFVWRDYNNAVTRLAPGGWILCHDFIPPTEEGTAPAQSGDAFRFLAAIMDLTPQVQWYAAADELNIQGLTAVRNARQVPYVPEKYAALSYPAFREKIAQVKRYGYQGLQTAVRQPPAYE